MQEQFDVTEIESLRNRLEECEKELLFMRNAVVENELRVRFALSAVNDGVWDWDLNSGNIFFSDRFFSMLGYDPFEMPQEFQSWHALIHPNDLLVALQFIEKIKNALCENLKFEYRLRKKDGSFCWILLRAKIIEKNQTGNPVRVIGTHVDINHFKQIELSLVEKENRLTSQNAELVSINKQLAETDKTNKKLIRQLQDKQAYLDSILAMVPVAIALVSDRVILYVNNYACIMTGYEKDELLGQNTILLYPSEPEYENVQSILNNNSISGDISAFSAIWKMKNDTLIDVNINALKFDTELADNIFIITASDVSAQRIYEDELISAKEEAEKAERLKTLFLCNISHELRTPMNGIAGFAEMLRYTTNQTKKEDYLKVIINSSKQLLKIITDIIDISKIETNTVEVFNSELNITTFMNEMKEFVIKSLTQRGKCGINVSWSNTGNSFNENIVTDEIKLRQIFHSILGNAVKFTDEGFIRFGYRLNNNTIEFFIADSGIGINESEKDFIFECFRQSETPTRKLYGGNGLGLAIAKGFAQMLGGTVWAAKPDEQGALFYVSLPYVPVVECINDNNVDMADNNNKWASFNLLVVEDDISGMSLIYELLEETGINIIHAVTGLEAVKICRHQPNLHLVLMDMRLPEMDGYEATKRIKEFRPELPIIAQTAHALSEDRRKCINAGCNDYLTKPLKQEQLFDIMSRFLEKHSS